MLPVSLVVEIVGTIVPLAVGGWFIRRYQLAWRFLAQGMLVCIMAWLFGNIVEKIIRSLTLNGILIQPYANSRWMFDQAVNLTRTVVILPLTWMIYYTALKEKLTWAAGMAVASGFSFAYFFYPSIDHIRNLITIITTQLPGSGFGLWSDFGDPTWPVILLLGLGRWLSNLIVFSAISILLVQVQEKNPYRYLLATLAFQGSFVILRLAISRLEVPALANDGLITALSLVFGALSVGILYHYRRKTFTPSPLLETA